MTASADPVTVRQNENWSERFFLRGAVEKRSKDTGKLLHHYGKERKNRDESEASRGWCGKVVLDTVVAYKLYDPMCSFFKNKCDICRNWDNNNATYIDSDRLEYKIMLLT